MKRSARRIEMPQEPDSAPAEAPEQMAEVVQFPKERWVKEPEEPTSESAPDPALEEAKLAQIEDLRSELHEIAPEGRGPEEPEQEVTTSVESFTTYKRCPACKGKGRRYLIFPCPECGGLGSLPEKTTSQTHYWLKDKQSRPLEEKTEG